MEKIRAKGYGPNWGNFNGEDLHLDSSKNSERVLMSVTPDMQKEVGALSTFHDIPVNRVYRAFIKYALKQVRRYGFHEIYREEVQPTVTGVNRGSELTETYCNRAIPPRRRQAS